MKLAGSGRTSIEKKTVEMTKMKNMKKALTVLLSILLIWQGFAGPWMIHAKAASTNSAPTVTDTSVAFSTIPEDANDSSNPGMDVSKLLNLAGASDADGNTLSIAVTSVDDTNGTWQIYYGGAWWQLTRYKKSVSDSNVYLVPNGCSVRFKPGSDFNGQASFTFRVWDETTGTADNNDDASGNNSAAIDASGSSNGGSTAFSAKTVTASIAVTAVNDAPEIHKKGLYNTLKFDGINDYLQVPGDLGISNGSFTVEGWIRADQITSFGRFYDFGNGQGENAGHNILADFQGTTNNMGIEIWNGAGRSSTVRIGADNFPLNTWVYLTTVYDSARQRSYMYWNGALKASLPVPSTTEALARVYNYFGRSLWPADGYFNGKMRGMSVWKEARTAGEATSDMNANFSGSEKNLLLYYPITDAVGSTTVASTTGTHAGNLMNYSSNEAGAETSSANNAMVVNDDAFTYQVTGFTGTNIPVDQMYLKDVDAGAAGVSLQLSTAQEGKLTVNQASRVSITGNDTGTLTMSGTVDDLNAALKTLAYHSASAVTDTITAAVTDNGNSGAGGALTASETIAVTVIAPPADAPTISRQPESITVHPGESAAFSVVASGAASLSYQWQLSKDGGSTWSDLSGETSSSYTVDSAVKGDDGNQYRCYIYDAVDNTSVTSEKATLTVLYPVLKMAGVTPANGATGVPVKSQIVMTFNEEIQAVAGKNISILDPSGTGITVAATSGSVSVSGSTVTVTLPKALDFMTKYHVLIDSGAFADSNSTAYGGISDSSTWSFTTEAAPAVKPAPPIAGSGGALSFDGKDDYVDLGQGVTLGKTFTEEVWVCPTTDNNWTGVMGHEEGDRSNYRAPCIYIYGGGTGIQVGFGTGSSWDSLYDDSCLKPNEWNHIAFVYDGNTIYLYINGIRVAQQNCGGHTPYNRPVKYFGRMNDFDTVVNGNSVYYNGQLDEVQLWNTARTQDEVRSDMYSRPTFATSGLAGYWSFDENSISTAMDVSTGRNNGTLTNMDTSSCRTDSGAWQNRITAEDTALTINAGYARYGGSTVLAQSAGPSHGTLSFDNSAETATYTPNIGYYGKDAFTYTVTEGGLSKSYTVNMTVVQKPDVTVGSQTATVGGTATLTANASVFDGGTLSYQWQQWNGSDWNNLSGETAQTYTTGVLASADSGKKYRCMATNTIGYTSASAASSEAALTVNKKAQSGLAVTGPTGNTLTYGDAFRLSVGGGDGSGVCSYESGDTNILTVDAGGNVTAAGVGSAVITVTRTGDSDYADSAPTQITITVTPKPLDITITPNDRTYDGGTSTGVKSIDCPGMIIGDDVSVTGTSLAFTDEAAGDGKTVTASGCVLSGAKKDDYTIRTLNVNSASIWKRTVTPSATANSKIYDGGIGASGTVSLSNVVNGDTVTASGNFTFSDKNAGTCKTVTAAGITLSGAKSGNYMLSSASATAAADITPKALSVTDTAVKDKTYDGKTSAEFSGAPALLGVVENDDVLLAGGTPSFESTNVSDSVKVDFSAFGISGADAGNYLLTQPADGVVTAAIHKKALSVSIEPVTIFCGQSIPALTVKIDGFVNNETESSLTGFGKPAASPVGFGGTVKPAGTYPMTVSYTDGDSTGNYSFSCNTAASVTISSVSPDGSYTVTPSVPDGKNGWYVSDLTITPINGFDRISTDSADWEPFLTISAEALDGSVTFKLKKVSDSTQTESKTLHYSLDRTAPHDMTVSVHQNSFTTFLNTITFGLFFQNDVDVALSASDALSGIDCYEYQLVDTGKGQSYQAGNTWTKSADGKLSIPAQFKGAVYAYAVDKAGNRSAVVSSNGFVADNQIPSAPVITTTVNGNAYVGGWTSGNVKIVAAGSSALSGIDYYEYQTGDDGTWTKMPDQSGAADSTSGQTVADILTIASDMNRDIHIRAVSNSGIAGDESVVTVKRDTVTPVLDVSVTGTTGQWTGSPVLFTLSNTAGNISPCTYQVKIGSGDWTLISGNTVSVIADTDTSYQFKAVSASGIESSLSAVYAVRIDRSSPTITSVSGNPADWTNGDVTLTVHAGDNGSGVKEYSFDGGHNWQTSNTNLYTVNQTVSAGSIRVRDNVGNETGYSTEIAITKIDKIAPAVPTVTINSNPVKQVLHAISFGLFFNDTVNVSLSSTDSQSGIQNYEYQLVSSDGGILSSSGWTACDGTFSVSPQFRGTVYARTTDNVGNRSNVAQSDKFVTDRQTPTAPNVAETVGGKAYDGTNWTSGNIRLAASGSAALSGIDYYEYSTDEGHSWTKMQGRSPATDSTSGQGINAAETISTDGNGTVLVHAISNSGITGQAASIPVKRDAAYPGFTVDITGTVGQWTGSPVTFTLTGTGGNLSPVTYYVKIGTADWVLITGNKVTFSNSINETCQFKAVSAAGIEAASEIYSVMIDAGLPTLAVSGNPSEWTNQDVTLGVDAECSPYGVQSVTVSKDGESAVTITGQSTYTVTENGKYDFTAANRAGASVSKTVSVTKIDKAAPTGMTVKVHTNSFTGFLHAISFGLFFNSTTDITLSADDALSGVGFYEYQMVDTSKGQSFKANGTWEKSVGGTFSIDPQFKGVIYARAVDQAGNVTASGEIVQTDGFTVDHQTPTAPTATTTENGGAYSGGWTSGNVKIVASGSESLSGIKYYEYKIGDGGTWTEMPDQSGTADSTSGQTIADTLTVTSDMNRDIHIRAVSNSGIEGSEAVVTVKRDSVIPSLHVEVSGTTGQWTEDPVTFTFSNTQSNLSPVTYWVKAGSGDWTQISGNGYQVTGNVNTTYQFKAVSGSGLSSSASDLYTVKLAGDALKEVISNLDNLPNPSAASDQQISDREQEIKDTKILYDTLSKDEQSAIGQARVDKLNQLISRLNAILIVIPKDPGTGISTNNIGTSVRLPELNDPNISKVVVRLVVDPVSGTVRPSNVSTASVVLSNSNESIVAAYDVSLLKTVYDKQGTLLSSGKVGNSEIEGPVVIRIPVPSKFIGQTGLQVVYISDNGTVTPMPTELITADGVEYLQFTTTHFSLYAVTAPNKASAVPGPKTGDSSSDFLWYIWPLGASGLLLAGELVTRRRNRKSASRK